jgi:long-chain acyl-CoA synthetase
MSTARHPWEKSYPSRMSWSDPLPEASTIESYLEIAAEKWPDRTAIDFYDHLMTYRELRDLAARAAEGLQKLGVGPGINVGLHLPNTPHFVICFFGVLMSGGRAVNFNPLCGLNELGAQLYDSEPKVLITGNWLRQYPDLRTLKGGEVPNNIVVCSLRDFLEPSVADSLARTSDILVSHAAREISFCELITNDGKPQRHPRGKLEDEVAVLQYTGGTTGEPKGAMLTHANFSAVVAIVERWVRSQQNFSLQIFRLLPFSQMIRITGLMLRSPLKWRNNLTFKTLGVLPLSHIFGLIAIMLSSIANGSELVLHLRFDAGRVLADITHKKINMFSGVPAMFWALVNHSKFRESSFSSVFGCGSAGAPLPLALRKHFEAGTDRTLSEGYGLTETTGLGTLLPMLATQDQRTRHVGLPVPLTLVEVVDLATGLELLPIGEIGELCFTGPQVMKGYWRKPVDNAEAFRGGRFHSGDIGFIDENGYVTLTERKKDVVFVGGRNVYPRNIECAIYEHPDVMEVTVIGVHSRDFGEVLKAFIALKPGSVPFTYRDLCNFLAKKVASYELPMEIEFRESLPKTPVGKLSKKELIAEEVAKRKDPLRA